VALGLQLAWALQPRAVWFHPSSTQLNIEEMDQPTFHLHALKGDRSLKEAAMRMKTPAHPGELVAANLKELGLSVAEAAKAIGVIRQQLYPAALQCHQRQKRGDAGNGRALREGGGADVWLRMQAAHDLAKARQSEEEIRARRLARPYDGSHFRPALVEMVADRALIGARMLIAARQGFTDANKERRPRPARPPRLSR
jgi:antitoxin HigA-1